MKKWIRWAAAAGMAVALLGGSAAFAAEDSGIAVQLDGKALAFSDAVPQVKEERTFLPFRAVFEALGAQVSNEGSVITAVREGKTLTMTLGETAATVTEGDKTTSIAMDVAPYVDDTTWRTYVPVRFAAQAFDCAVGWDQDKSTVILVDADKLVEEAMEGREFNYLGWFSEYSGKYNHGIWDMKGDFQADLTVMSAPMTMEGTLAGTVADADKMSVDMNMKMDMEQFLQAVTLLSGESAELDEEDRAVLDALKTKGMDLAMRGDLAQGKLYMNLDGALFTASGMDSATWYSLDMAQMAQQMGMDWTELMNAAKSVDYQEIMKKTLGAVELTDAAAGYQQVKDTVTKMADAFCDQGFTADGNTCSTTLTISEDGTDLTLGLSLTMEEGQVTAYAMTMDLSAAAEGQTMTMGMTAAMDANDQMTAQVKADVAGLVTMDMKMNCAYTSGQTAPVTEPPAGAQVVDYMELMAAEMDAEAGAIGGADGSTQIVVGQ